MKAFNLEAIVKNRTGLLLGWALIALPVVTSGQPANYTNDVVVDTYVRQMLYWPNADAAFRYKHLLYQYEAGKIRPELTNMVTLYTASERSRAAQAENYVEAGLTNKPGSALLARLLLDIYYDRTAAEAILAREAVQKAQRAHFGPPIARPAPTGGFIIDNEVQDYQAALDANRLALEGYCRLLTNTLGVADGIPIPLGYRIFQEQVPARGLAPASYVDTNGVAVSVTTNTSSLFDGYKDLVLLYELLSDQGRTAATLSKLLLVRNSPGDVALAEAFIVETERSLFLHSQLLRAAFPLLSADAGACANSGLAAAMAAVSDSLNELDGVRKLQRSRLNPLGFEPDFLVLVQKGALADEDDTYDAFLAHLASPDSALGVARSALANAGSSYAQYRGFEDDLAEQFNNSSITYYDRLRDIVGYFPYDPSYGQYPQGASGSELDQQALSIEAARLQIRKNQAEIANLNKQVGIELAKAANISSVYISYGQQQATLTACIGVISGLQEASSAMAEACASTSLANPAGGTGHAINAVAQLAAEVTKGLLEGEKEKLAAMQSAEITGIEAQATVKTLLLQMNTLAVDSLAAALQLRKDVNRLQDLYREKAQLERNLKEKDQNLARRYFADPVHRLSMQADMIEADLKFKEAQQWLFFMARALEYKWNEPFAGSEGWSLQTLFKLRNANELWAMYQAMNAFDNGKSLYSVNDDRWDWLSLREDLLGYRQFGNHGETLSYVDPETGETVDALTMFRRYLQRHQDANGVMYLEFSTVRQNHNTFFRGPDAVLNTPGQYLDKIDSMVIRIPGRHTTTNYTQWDTLAGALAYGGSSYLRNEYPGTPAPGRSDHLVGEMTAYSTKWWYETTEGVWRFREMRTNSVSMLKASVAVPRPVHDFPSDIPDRLATHALIINTFRERSVATSRWILRIPTRHPQIAGVQTLRIEELDDVELYFYHWSYERP